MWMQYAIDKAVRGMRRGEVPVGAVIVFNNKIISTAHNNVERFGSTLAHAEIITITQTQKKLKTKYLHNCDLYVTLQPCPMCAAALTLSRIRRVYFGAYDNSINIPRFESFETIGGIREKECENLLKEFFFTKRTL